MTVASKKNSNAQRGYRVASSIVRPITAHSPLSGSDRPVPTALHRTACKPAAPRDHALGNKQLVCDEPARSPVMG